jgi:uncharacterized 2Fe-2S/4Fe-4S cluster protein (DUF4445 family)
VVSNDTTVYVPPASVIETPVIQLESFSVSYEAKPAVAAVTLDLPPPSLDDQRADLQRVADALRQKQGFEGVRASLPALRALSKSLREGNWKIAIAVKKDEIISAYPERIPAIIGLAVDVGTTKLACYLVDLETGNVLAAKGAVNPQVAYGEDVISRLRAAMDNPDDALRMQQLIAEVINTVALEMCATLGLKAEHIIDVCLVGNTAMHHLLLGLPVHQLALSPFIPVTASSLNIYANILELHTAPSAYAYLPPPIAGFVGSDHLAVLLAAGFEEDNRIRVAIDIGTNTEIALQARGRIVSCSTASGPAFEGAHISQGMRAAPGAIRRVTIGEDGTVMCDVIGGGPAYGICGSGVLDTIVEMRAAGITNERGRLIKERPGVRLEDGNMPAFLLAKGDSNRRDVVITQKDIDQVLLAKGAIRAGMEILMDYLKVTAQDIEEFNLAGAFGTYLDPRNAVRIGLLPQIALDRIRAIGNAAGAGARMMLVSTDARRRAVSLAEKVDYLELTVYPEFSKFFAKGIRLPSA